MSEALFTSSVTETLTIGTAMSVIFVSLIIGLFISVVYIKTRG